MGTAIVVTYLALLLPFAYRLHVIFALQAECILKQQFNNLSAPIAKLGKRLAGTPGLWAKPSAWFCMALEISSTIFLGLITACY